MTMERLKIERLTSVASAMDIEALGRLLGQLTGTPDAEVCRMDIEAVMSNPAVSMFVGREEDGGIVACGCLGVIDTLSGRKGHIEDVVVDSGCRGKGYGRIMVEYLIEAARTMGPMELFLTSRPSRTAANALYQSLGFVRKETNCYRMEL